MLLVYVIRYTTKYELLQNAGSLPRRAGENMGLPPGQNEKVKLVHQ